MRNSLSLLGLLMVLSMSLSAQDNRLSYDQFMEWVKLYHPVAKQADLLLDLGTQEVRKARGGFDPYLYGSIDEKQYQEKEYYNKKEAELVVPTIAGVELQGVFEKNRGAYLNPEHNVPDNGLYSLGASINVGNGLLIDKRRAALKQAKIYNKATQEERRQSLNLLYYDATVVYWKWAGAFADLKVNEKGLRVAKERFEAVKGSFEQGDLPAIDTVEAYTQVLNREIKFQKAGCTFFSSMQELNVYLWDADQNSIDLSPSIAPDPLVGSNELTLDEEYINQALINHPELRMLDYDLAYLNIERRYKAEQLKPKIKLKYNFLTETLGGLEQVGFYENNYKFGIQVSTPLLLRKERGDLGMTKVKIKDVNYKRDLKLEQLAAKLRKVTNEYDVLNSQLSFLSQNIKGLETLLRGERMKFDMGESSLFLINAREKSLFDSQLVYNSVYVDLIIAYSKIRTAAGLGFEGYGL